MTEKTAQPDAAEKASPWDRRPGEPGLWWGRFLLYRDLGPKRAIRETYQRDREARGRRRSEQISGAWYRAAVQWEWKKRADAWDVAERERLEEEREALRLEDRAARIEILKAARFKLVQALDKLKPEDASWTEVYSGLKMVNGELRAEHDDEPKQRVEAKIEHAGQVDLTVKVLKGVSMDDL